MVMGIPNVVWFTRAARKAASCKDAHQHEKFSRTYATPCETSLPASVVRALLCGSPKRKVFLKLCSRTLPSMDLENLHVASALIGGTSLLDAEHRMSCDVRFPPDPCHSLLLASVAWGFLVRDPGVFWLLSKLRVPHALAWPTQVLHLLGSLFFGSSGDNELLVLTCKRKREYIIHRHMMGMLLLQGLQDVSKIDP